MKISIEDAESKIQIEDKDESLATPFCDLHVFLKFLKMLEAIGYSKQKILEAAQEDLNLFKLYE